MDVSNNLWLDHVYIFFFRFFIRFSMRINSVIQFPFLSSLYCATGTYMNAVFPCFLGGTLPFDRRGLHWAILHLDVDLAEPIPLHPQLPLRRLHDSSRSPCQVSDCAMLLPVVQQRLLLVVVSFIGVMDRPHCTCSCTPLLFLHQVGDYKVVSGILYLGYMLGTYAF